MSLTLRRAVVIFAVLAGFLVAGLFISDFFKQDKWDEIIIATGTEGGTCFALGKDFAHILEREESIDRATSIETNGSVENIERLITGTADIAFVMRPALDDADQEDRSQLRIVARLYRDNVQIVVRKDAGINSLYDLEGKEVYIGANGSGTRIVAVRILETLVLSILVA